MTRTLSLLLATALTPAAAGAQTITTGLGASAIPQVERLTLGLGAAVVPQFEGASDYRVLAAPSFSFDLGTASVRSTGPGIEADFLSTRAFDAGPIFRWNGGRDPSDTDSVAVSALPEVDGTAMLGGFVQANVLVGEGVFLAPRFDILKGTGGGHEGLIAEASIGLTKRMDRWTVGGSTGITYADDTYMETFFSVAPASPSGLAAFSAGSGIKDVGLTAFASYALDDNWSFTAVAGYKRLLGDAADSPVVDVEGDANQAFLSLGVSYTFN